jgi:iron complex outermembrane recepter protein
MMYRARVIRIAYTHRPDGNRNAGDKIVKLTQEDRRKGYTYSDTYSAVEVMAVNKTLILFDIIHSERKIIRPGFTPSKKISFPSYKDCEKCALTIPYDCLALSKTINRLLQMRKTALCFLIILLSYAGLYAQQITGLAQDDQGKPLTGASATLKNNKDSSVVKLSISNSTGQYEFTAITHGQYFVTISHIGYATQSSANFETIGDGSFKIPTIMLARTSRELKQTVVTTQKPLVEVKTNRIILNVEGNINEVGSNALELLRKSPGVTVDKDNNLSLNGKTGVQIYVDGRPTYVSGATLADYLKTLQSSSISSIEIISNPSAKYEAAGSAGIIDIRLKKNTAYGNNGSASAGYNIGTYSKYNANLSLNHRDAHFNVYGDYSLTHGQYEQYATMYRTQLDTLFLQRSTFLSTPTTSTYKAGADWFPNKKSTLGLLISGSSGTQTIQTTSATPIVYVPANQTDRLLQANNHTTSSNDNVNADLNYRYADTSGHELNIDADYSLYHLRSNQYQPNNYFDSTGKTLLYSNDYNILSPTNIHIYSLKVDYEANFLKGRLGFGAKSSYVTTTNDFQEYDLYPWVRELDSLSSDNFDYKENINAGYVNYNRTIKGWIFQGGLRAENTNDKGTSMGWKQTQTDYSPYDSSFERHYTDLFPSAAITYNKNPNNQWTLNYSRRIDRPAYQSLNPFQFKLDDYTFSQGNTLLRPQYANSAGLTFMYKYRLTVTLNYSHIKDLNTTLVDTIDGSKAIIRTENLAKQDIAGLNISYPFQYRWYSVFFNANTYYSLNKANFGAGRTVDLNVFHTTIFSQHSFRLGGGWTGQLTEYFSSPDIWQATLRSSTIWSLDAGLQKTVLKGNGSFKVSVTDIFKGLDYTATSSFAGQYIRDTGGYESRMLKLFFTYRFGNQGLKAARRHSNAAEEETKRVGSGSGGNGTP